MYYHGSFLNIAGETVTVHILTKKGNADIEIGDEGSGIWFADENPVEITSSFNDSFDVLLRSEATITLQTRDFLPDLFCTSCRDAVVNIFVGSRCVFAGFVMPQAYSQGYAEVYDELTISCIDALSALQYSKYDNIGGALKTWNMAATTAGQRSMWDIMKDILEGVSSGLRLQGSGTMRVWYDGCRSMTSTKDYAIFQKLGVSELLFIGSSEDEVWTQEDVLTEILRYLNLHIIQDGFDFRIFSWESVAGTAAIPWRDLRSASTQQTARTTVDLTLANAADCDTTIGIGEVYNRICLTCELDPVDTIVESPLDSSALTSPYSNRQLYMREYVVEGSGKNGAVQTGTDGTAFQNLWDGKRVTHEGAWTRDWYLRVMDHPYWKFPDRHTGLNLIQRYCLLGTNQQALPNALASQIGAALISWGSVKEQAYRTDDSVPGKLDMSSALVVSVNGNQNADKTAARPNDSDILGSAPVAVYDGPVSGAAYSPADDSTVNYIVFTGSIILNLQPQLSMTSAGALVTGTAGVKPDRDGNGGHYYAQRYFKTENPRTHAVADPSTLKGLQPFTEIEPAALEYKYSPDLTGVDKVGKVPVLRCMLVIGDKCAVETGDGTSVSDFEWRTFKERAQCASDSEYYAQSFTLGFNPAIGDKILGTEFKILNNIPYHLGLDTEGTAIPVKRADALSGAVRFMVVGPVNSEWEERLWQAGGVVIKRTSYLLLPYLSDIIVRDFEVKLVSDNGGTDLQEDCELVYMSDTAENFVNEKDDITFRLTSALTADERRELGVAEETRNSTVVDLSTGLGVTEVYDHVKGAAVKPEKSYVDSYYNELHEPRLTMTHRVSEGAGAVDLLKHYRHQAMPGKIFYAQAIGRDLRMAEAVLTLKERWT